jgi:hypothetical protein
MENRITISRTTAERAIHRLADWLQFIDNLEPDTRADIIALDELIRATDGEELFRAYQEAEAEKLAQLNKDWQERKAAEEAAKNDN